MVSSSLEGRDPVTAWRGAVLVLCGLLSVLAASRTYAALPIALLGALALVGARSERARAAPLALGLAEAAVAGASVVLTGGSRSPLLPYLLVPPVCVVSSRGVRGALLLSGTAAGALLLTRGLVGGAPFATRTDALGDLTTASAQWVLIGLALVLLLARATDLSRSQPDPQDRYGEARALLEQLRLVSRRLPGGLDETSSAEALLTECAAVAPSDRSAVLVQAGPGSLSPVAVRGTRRVPWRAPLDQPGPLRDAWDTGTVAVDRRPADPDGERRGSVLVVVPLLSDGAPYGLVVLEAFDPDALPAAEVEQLSRCVAAGSLRLETALLFAEVRSAVTVEERDRLAREIHDGIAQDLASVGYQLDELRLHAAKVDPALAASVGEVRRGLTRHIGDLRLSITDLRTSVSSDRGLGSALSSYVRAVGSGQRFRVHLTLQESAFRLPADQEVLLFQIAHAVAQDVRRMRDADNLWVDLAVDPPHARLVVEHDDPRGCSGELSAYAGQLARAGGDLQVHEREGGGVRVVAELGARVPL